MQSFPVAHSAVGTVRNPQRNKKPVRSAHFSHFLDQFVVTRMWPKRSVLAQPGLPPIILQKSSLSPEVQMMHPSGMTAHPNGPCAAPRKDHMWGLQRSVFPGSWLWHWAHFTHHEPHCASASPMHTIFSPVLDTKAFNTHSDVCTGRMPRGWNSASKG